MGLYRSVNFWHTSSEAESGYVKQMFGSGKRTVSIPNLPSKDILMYQPPRRTKQRGTIQFVMLTRINRTKNIHYALELLRHFSEKIVLHIYGNMEDEDYWRECTALIDKLPTNVDIKYCGVVPYAKVLDTFAKYHVFLFPTLTENFGHAVLEALTAGCPVITTHGTPWHDIQENGVGWYLPLEQPQLFLDAIAVVLHLDDVEFQEMSLKSEPICAGIRAPWHGSEYTRPIPDGN